MWEGFSLAPVDGLLKQHHDKSLELIIIDRRQLLADTSFPLGTILRIIVTTGSVESISISLRDVSNRTDGSLGSFSSQSMIKAYQFKCFPFSREEEGGHWIMDTSTGSLMNVIINAFPPPHRALFATEMNRLPITSTLDWTTDDLPKQLTADLEQLRGAPKGSRADVMEEVGRAWHRRLCPDYYTRGASS